MREFLSKGLALSLIIGIGVAWAFGCNEWEKAGDCEVMDAREKHYDADGYFILIDTQEGLMGAYDAYKPLRHFWYKEFRKIKPGLYKYDSYEDLMELSSEDTEEVYNLYLSASDLRYLQATIEQGIPVLVY